MLAALVLVGAANAQERPLLVDLRSGEQLEVTSIRGAPASGLELSLGATSRSVALRDVLAIRATAARAPELLRAELAGGDLVHGALSGGDEHGDLLELLSPVLGKVELPVDRLRALVEPGVHPADQLLPDGVDEALFLSTGRGYDVVAGTLHRFDARGISFQPITADGPQWFATTRFSSLRLAGALSPTAPMPATLWTRAADRVGVRVVAFADDGVTVALSHGGERRLRWDDVACLVLDERVVHLSDLEPVKVVEGAFDGEVVHAWRRDECVTGGPLQVLGRTFGRGLGVHSRSRLTFRAPAGATHFRARVAIDDSATELPLRAHAVARVVKNGDVAFACDDLRSGEAARDCGLLPVDGGDTITLEVDFGSGRDLGDRVDWLLPVFLMRAGS